MSYLQASGARAAPVLYLTEGLLAISIGVVIVLGIALAVGVMRRRLPNTPLTDITIKQDGAGGAWITVGLIVTIPIVIGAFVWSTIVLAQTMPAPNTPLRIEVTARQWWWEVYYPAGGGAPGFATANEIHIPVGRPVLLQLRAADVIHSFWVPALGGKTDMIPGRVTRAWIEARAPGEYVGRCAEFCGLDHALMGVRVIAETPAGFQHWRVQESANAATPITQPAMVGAAIFSSRCTSCHVVRGAPRRAPPAPERAQGPDLTHLAARRHLAAELMANTPDHLAGWLANPQALKPGVAMPVTPLSGPQLQALLAYLDGLN